jgi:hypothetical protein
MGGRLTWVIVASVGGLLLIAGLDALRSSEASRDSAPAASTKTTRTAADVSDSLLPCDTQDLRISIVVRRGSPTVVARNFGDTCYRLLHGWHLRVEDRAGDALVEWDEIGPLADGIFPADSESSFGFSRGQPIRCKSPGPYLVSATVGPYFARRGHLSAGEISCVRSVTTTVRQEIERNGNRWALLFATSHDGSACNYQVQPLCERIACVRAGGFKIRSCRPPTRAFRISFQGAEVQNIVIRRDRAAARFSNGEFVELVRVVDRWLIVKVGGNAGRGFFE